MGGRKLNSALGSLELEDQDSNLFFFGFCPFFLEGHTHGIWRFPGQGSNRSYSSRPTPQPQPCQMEPCL